MCQLWISSDCGVVIIPPINSSYRFQSSTEKLNLQFRASALARNCHTSLAKSFQSPRPRGVAFAGSEYRFWPVGKWLVHGSPADQLHKLTVLVQEIERLTARGEDDGTATRTPSAWMDIDRIFFLHRAKSCSQPGSLLASGNGLLLPSAEGSAVRSLNSEHFENCEKPHRFPAGPYRS